MKYKITKFDSQNRNEKGHYIDDSEWTAISDIEKSSYSNVSYHVDAIKTILKEKNITSLLIDSFELHNMCDDFEGYKKDGRLRDVKVDFSKEIKVLKNGVVLKLEQVRKIIRLILRETVWMSLFCDDFKITFGYDYYMYVECSKLTEKTINQIESSGLFVEL